jgi:hypothetical protein
LDFWVSRHRRVACQVEPAQGRWKRLALSSAGPSPNQASPGARAAGGLPRGNPDTVGNVWVRQTVGHGRGHLAGHVGRDVGLPPVRRGLGHRVTARSSWPLPNTAETGGATFMQPDTDPGAGPEPLPRSFLTIGGTAHLRTNRMDREQQRRGVPATRRSPILSQVAFDPKPRRRCPPTQPLRLAPRPRARQGPWRHPPTPPGSASRRLLPSERPHPDDRQPGWGGWPNHSSR